MCTRQVWGESLAWGSIMYLLLGQRIKGAKALCEGSGIGCGLGKEKDRSLKGQAYSMTLTPSPPLAITLPKQIPGPLAQATLSLTAALHLPTARRGCCLLLHTLTLPSSTSQTFSAPCCSQVHTATCGRPDAPCE